MKRQILGAGFLLVLASAAAAVSGCSDKTTQQYHDQEEQAVLAQLKAVEGAYTGTISSLDDQSLIGGIQITLKTSSQLVPSSDQTTTESQASLTGSVKIMGMTTSEASLTATYAPDTKVLNGTITISNTASNENLTLGLTGSINGSSLTGTIESQQYPGDGGSFTTTLNGSLPTAQGSTSGAAPSYLTRYSGTGDDGLGDCVINGNTCDVTLTIDDTPSSNFDSFADAVVRVSDVVVNVVITLNDTGAIGAPVPQKFSFGGTYGTAQLDRRNGILLGEAPGLAGVNNTDKLNCKVIGGMLDGSAGWTCNLDKVHFRITPSAADSQ